MYYSYFFNFLLFSSYTCLSNFSLCVFFLYLFISLTFLLCVVLSTSLRLFYFPYVLIYFFCCVFRFFLTVAIILSIIVSTSLSSLFFIRSLMHIVLVILCYSHISLYIYYLTILLMFFTLPVIASLSASPRHPEKFSQIQGFERVLCYRFGALD